MTGRPLLASLVAGLVATACGSSSPERGAPTPPAAQPVVVETAPAEADVAPGGTLLFTAKVTGSADTLVRWSVDEPGGGSIAANGRYTAPAIEGTFHVRAEHAASTTNGNTNGGSLRVPGAVSTSAKGGGKSVVHVGKVGSAQQVVVVVNPGTATVPAGGSVTFAAAVTGTANTSVGWSVQEGAICGSVSSAGVYSAPNVASTCHVVATSKVDTTRSASASITVTAPPPSAVAISISPATATLDACKAQVFTATVTNATNGAVTWTVIEAGGGTVTNGTYTAPQTAGTYHVVATSVADPTKTVQGTITVGPEKVMSVAVAPGSGTVQANGALAFAATVTTTCGTFAAQ
jgi:hypothetical protein